MNFFVVLAATILGACSPVNVSNPQPMAVDFNQTNSAVVQNNEATKVLGNQTVIPGIATVINDNKTNTVEVVFTANASVDLVVQVSNSYYTTTVTGNAGDTIVLNGTDANGKTAKINNIWVVGSAVIASDPKSDWTETQISYNRYRAYVNLWNDLVYGANGYGRDSDVGNYLAAQGGADHYWALVAAYPDASPLPPYYYFSDEQKDTYDMWADNLEQGLLNTFDLAVARGMNVFADGQVANTLAEYVAIFNYLA